MILDFSPLFYCSRYPFDGPGNALAHAYYPYEFGSHGGDIHFDNDEQWLTEKAITDNEDSLTQNGIDFFSVAVRLRCCFPNFKKCDQF